MNPNARSPVHQAVLECRDYHFRYLLNTGAPVDCRDLYGMTPLQLCCLLDNEQFAMRCVKKLLKLGAYLNARDCQCRTALHHCCIIGRTKMARLLLLQEQIDLRGRDKFDYTPLMYASMRGDPALVILLVDAFALHRTSVDADRREGFTPLMIACRCANYVSAHILLTRGRAEATPRDDENFRNACEWARLSRQERLPGAREYHAPPSRPVDGRSGLTTIYDIRRLRRCDPPVSAPPPSVMCPFVLPCPELHNAWATACPEEDKIDGEDSLCVLLEALHDATSKKAAHEYCSFPVEPPAGPQEGESEQKGSPQEGEPAACCPRPSTPELAGLCMMAARGMKPGLGELLSLYLCDDVPVQGRVAARDHVTEPAVEMATSSEESGENTARSTGKGAKRGNSLK